MQRLFGMSLAVDQVRLRRIVKHVLPGYALEREEAETVLEFVQLAAGIEHEDDPMEHAVLMAIAQQIGATSGFEPPDMLPFRPMSGAEARMHWLRALAAQLRSQGARELAYVMSFLATVADLELTDDERRSLEELQRALGVDDRRATDLTVTVTEIVAADTAA